MIKTNIYTHSNTAKEEEKKAVTGFLAEHLEQYGDKEEDIAKAFDYALQEQNTPGGFVVTAHADGDVMAAAAIVNKTGMKGYIPENILVYIATHKDHRGKGIANKVMDLIVELADGDIALHVEPDNPAVNLYKKFGFTNKYLEMRLLKPKA
jgi:ribosomal protein S18 acetylase RimI-like enzyme